jgi:type II secretory pathway component PulC
MTLAKYQMNTFKQPVNLPVGLVPNIVTSLEKEQQQTLFLDHPLLNVVKQPMISVQLPVTNVEQLAISTQYPETSHKNTETPVKKPMTSVNQLVSLISHPVISPQSNVQGQKQKPLSADQPMLISLKQPVSSSKQSGVSISHRPQFSTQWSHQS